MPKNKTDRYEGYIPVEGFSQQRSIQLSSDPTVNQNYFGPDSLAGEQSIPPKPFGHELPDQSRDEATVPSKTDTSAVSFDDVYKTAVFPDNFLIINDIVLTDVPTTAVKFISSDGVFIAETIRTSAPVVTPNHAQSLGIKISLIFEPTQEAINKLRRLVSVISVHPLVFVYNNKIRKNFGIKHDENTIFILEHGTLRSSPDAVGSILLDLTLHYFNYKPFSNHFWYNASMPSNRTREERLNEAVALTLNNQNLGDMTGYEASAHSIEKEAEDLIRQMKIGVYKLDNNSISTNQPVPFPAASETWMYFADHLAGKSNPLSIVNSDYIGFEMREYEQVSPPNGAQASAGDSKLILNQDGFPKYSKFYEARKSTQEALLARTSTQRKAEAIASTEDATRGEAPSKSSATSTGAYDNSSVRAAAGGQPWVEIYNSLFTNGKDTWAGNVGLDKGIHLSSHLEDETGYVYDYKGASKCNLLFYETIYRAGYKVPIIKRKRGKGYPGIGRSIKNIQQGKNNMIRLTGRSKGEIQAIIDSGVPVGLFWDGPSAHVINVTQLRKIEYNGSVITKIIAKGLDQHGHNVHVRNLKQLKEKDQHVGIETFEIAAAIPLGSTAPMPDPMWSTPNARPGEPQMPHEEQLSSFEDNYSLQMERETGRSVPPRKLGTRTKWIRDTEEKQDLTYYWADAKLRNIFYRTIGADINSDVSAQRSGLGLRDLVCSSISLDFGHRIVPQRLIGQDTATFQFLGAGNKSGSLIFTFAGAEGRKSADYLKSIFHRARANAKLYGALIPDAGTVKVNRADPRETNNNINNLLALLDINHIVISEITEASVPGSSDKHNLVVSFVSQEFAKEGLERRFLTNTESKKRIIARILDFVKAYKITDRTVSGSDGVEYDWHIADFGAIKDNYHIKPDPTYIEENRTGHNGYSPQPYRVKPNTLPHWMGEAITNAAKICNKLNHEMPPVLWANDNGTWRDRYAEFGAEDIMKGQVQNIDPAERNKTQATSFFAGSFTVEDAGLLLQQSPGGNLAAGQQQAYAATKRIDESQIANDKMFSGSFDHNGGKNTTKIHEEIYVRFADQLSFVVDEVKKYMLADKKNFKNIFGSISDELMEAVISSIGECYADMEMPIIPGGNLPMPPEFYVFNDSDEDPALSALTDDYNMEAFLQKHIQNERASIKHYLQDAFLGGSYLSQNMPKMLRERADYVSQFQGVQVEQTGEIGEFDFFNPDKMLGEGVKTWEPLYYNASEIKDVKGHEGTDPVAWKDFVDKKYDDSWFGTSEDKVKTKYMDNIVALSPYLKHGRGTLWNQGEDSSDNTDIIKSVYGDDWNRIAFGPDPNNATTDERLDGHVTSPATAHDREIQTLTAAKSKAKAENKAILVGGAAKGIYRTVLPDGSITIGGNEQIETNASHQRLATSAADNTPKSMAARNEEAKQKFINQWFKKYNIIRENASTLQFQQAIAAFEQTKYSFSKSQKATPEELQAAAMKFPSHEGLSATFKNGDQDRDLARMVKGIAFGAKAEDLSIRRAYPTFKIYFIEDDSQETERVDGQVLRAFDDFYSYSSIQEIKVIRSRRVAGDLAVIRMTNVGGKLLRKRYGDKDPVAVDGDTALKYGVGAEYATGFFADTEKENPFEKMVLQDGVKTQIRLGYANDPDLLDTVFLGQIVEVSPREEGRIIEIVCQGYGAELESVELGPLEDGPVFYSTQQVLSGAIIQDSIVNFGRRSKYNKFNVAEGRHAFTGGLGKGISAQNLDDLIHSWGDDNQYKQFYKYQFLNYPQDDNIFAPPPAVYATTWMRFWNNACIYRPLNQTPWEIFKEHELRHPGYISLAVPYGHSPRMTMFFGAKSQHYWSKPPSQKEIFLSESLADNVSAGRGLSSKALRQNPFLANQMLELAKTNPDVARAVLLDLSHYGAPVSVGKAVGELYGRYIPFRNYHYFDAAHHILKNEIKTSKDGVFNEMEVLFFENENDITDTDADDIAQNTENLVRKEAGILACKLDDNLPEEHIRSYTKAFPSCISSDMAKRYIQGLFARHLRDAYKGDLIVLGESKLKPYDICYLNDTSINMTGPIEVEAVQHIFNRDHGWISIITPDLCIDINDYYAATVFDLAGSAHAHMRLGDIPTMAGIGTIASGYSFLGLAAAAKFMQWTQDGVPVISTPLTLAGKPFMSVAMGQKNASLFYTWGGQWNQHWDDVRAGWQKFDFAETLMDTSRSWQESINTVMSRSKGAGYSLEKS